MSSQNFFTTFVTKLSAGYINLVNRTGTVVLSKEELPPNSIFGFWHGDSYTMNLFLKNVKHNDLSINVVVTASSRGDLIEYTINAFGAEALRISDGFRAKENIKTLYRACEQENNVLAISLDGPTGPYKQPKRISSKLAEKYGKTLYTVDVEYSRVITLNRRWDKYKIPLPFSTIKFDINS